MSLFWKGSELFFKVDSDRFESEPQNKNQTPDIRNRKLGSIADFTAHIPLKPNS